ncbi:MAG: malonic semialdehyde reductase [Gallionellales bacterium GWA2_60_18]|nr:MAG: malonic semialdehyde reductase [Gallionellales bacterium GWA2_60_18]
MSNTPLPQAALDQLFLDAHTHNAWQERPVPDELLRRLYDTFRMGPTSANCCPARIVFVKSKAAKEKLMPALMEGNRAKTMAAPVTAIVGYDLRFYERLGKLYPNAPDAASWFNKDEQTAQTNAFRNGTLQGGYLIVAARALGLDCGPMSGFDNAAVDGLFFAGTSVRSNFLCNLGYGDPKGVYPRNPRLDFDEACRIE